MAAQVAPAGGTPWPYHPYVEHMARWERRQLFLRSYHFSRDAEPPRPSRRARRVVVRAGARRLRRAAAAGLRRLRARLRLCFGWAAGPGGFRYGRLSGGAGKKARTPAASACFW